MQEVSADEKTIQEIWSKHATFKQNMIFFGYYIGLNIGLGIVASPLYSLFERLAFFRDSSLLIAVALYSSIIMLLFFYIGMIIHINSPLKFHQKISTVLSVAVIGIILWFYAFRSTMGIKDAFESFFSPWLFYKMYFLWMMPIYDFLKDYLSIDRQIMVVIAFIPFVPSLLCLLGLELRNRFSRVILKRVLICIPCILLVLLLVSFIPHNYLFTWDEYPMVDGATAAIPFGKILAQELMGISKRQADQNVRFNTTHQAYLNLIEKRADVIFVAGPSNEELKMAQANRVTMKLTPIGKDAFIFIVHKDNPVNNLSFQQLQAVYSGKAVRWQELGGADVKITAYQREENSGSQTFMENKVMNGLPLAKPPQEQAIDGMGGLIDTVADYHNSQNAIGYSFYYYANEMHRSEKVKFLRVNGIECNKRNIINDRYPFTAVLYGVTREGEPDNSPANRLLRWLRSQAGRETIEKGGFIPL